MTMTLVGDEQLIAAFKLVGGSASRKYARKSTSKAATLQARILRRRIKQQTGRVTGNLRTSIKSVARSFPKGKPTWIGRIVGPQFPKGAHGHLIDQGHRVWSHGQPTATHTDKNEILEPSFREAQRRMEKELTIGIWNQIASDFRRTAKTV